MVYIQRKEDPKTSRKHILSMKKNQHNYDLSPSLNINCHIFRKKHLNSHENQHVVEKQFIKIVHAYSGQLDPTLLRCLSCASLVLEAREGKFLMSDYIWTHVREKSLYQRKILRLSW